VPWKQVNVNEQRIAFVLRARAAGANVSQLCREFGVSRDTGHRWLKRALETASVTELCESSRRPHHSPHPTEGRIEQRIVELRGQTGWGARKLQWLLAQEGVRVASSTVHRVIQRRGLIGRKDGHRAASQRFERAAPNQLWQMDGKGQYRLRDGWCYPLTVLDDHSRYALGVYALPSWKTELIWPCLVRTFERYGLPEAFLLDRGVPWWATQNGHGLTQFSVSLIEQGIDLIYGRPYHPQTRGKIERFHRTLDQSVRHRGTPKEFPLWPELLEDFRHDYNHRRPHEALGMQPPVTRYQQSARAYQSKPRPWLYPEGAEVLRLNPQGCLPYAGRRWFVCEAMAGRYVRLERFADRVLVSYRHLYIRELHLRLGQTSSIVLPRYSDEQGPSDGNAEL
jgi:transposase InsO family protein